MLSRPRPYLYQKETQWPTCPQVGVREFSEKGNGNVSCGNVFSEPYFPPPFLVLYHQVTIPFKPNVCL